MAAARYNWTPSRLALLLTCVPHLGEGQIAQVLQRWSRTRQPIEEILQASAEALQSDWGLSAQAAQALAAEKRTWWTQFEKLDALVRARGVEILTAQHRLYPMSVEQYCMQPPPLMFALGELRLLERGWRFAVVCSRGAPHLALEAVDEVVHQALRQGGVPVAGHNTLPYQRTALAAMRQDAPSITVLDRGLIKVLGEELNRPLFPTARLYELEFRVDRDVVLSPFPLQAGYIGLHNQRRDELVFALADVIFAVWVRAGGVMERLCLRAKELGKRVEVWKPPNGTVSEGVRILMENED